MSNAIMTQVLPIDSQTPDLALIQIAADKLRSGGLVAFPTETVYGLGANALDARAVDRIFQAKGRPASDPIIVHLHSMVQLEQVAVDVPALARQLAEKFWPGPLTLVLKRHAHVPPNVSAGRDTVAIRIPKHPVALALLRTADVPVAAPSANLFSHPSATTARHVLDDLGGRVDIVLDAGPAVIGLESTVLDLTKPTPAILRPGGVTLEALREIISDVQLISRLLDVDDSRLEAPGMLTKHYSPRAELLLFSGAVEVVIPRMQQTARERIALGQRVGILTPDAERGFFDMLPIDLVTMGADLDEIGHHLFAAVRELDRRGVDVILVRGMERTGLGAALWDRLLRAAEGRVIECC